MADDQLSCSNGAMTVKYPAFPSAKATVEAGRYMAAVAALKGVPLTFFDGSTILLPESETAAIDLLRARFDAVIEYGCGEEWEFANKARAAGVSERLIRLGNAVWDVKGQPVSDLIRAALDEPEAAYAEWSALYLASMEAH